MTLKMKIIHILSIPVILFLTMFSVSCTQAQPKKDSGTSTKTETIERDWKEILTPMQYYVMVEKGTERPFQNEYFDNHAPGIYVSAATGEPLFTSDNKFDSGTGWPCFSDVIDTSLVMIVKDYSHGMVRDEVVEKSTGLHLGHLFKDGPAPNYDRYCMNSAALKFIPATDGFELPQMAKAYFASGCFWCVEAIYESLEGVIEATNGYAGGHIKNPTYEMTNTGKTGHAEAVEVIYNPSVITFSQLVDVYFASQDPTQVNGQGPDRGSQYRSILFYQTPEEKSIIEKKIEELSKTLHKPVAAEVQEFDVFWEAEGYHQDFEKNNPNNPYIRAVSIPRFNEFKRKYPELIKKDAH